MKPKFLLGLIVGTCVGTGASASLRNPSGLLILEGPADLDHVRLRSHINENEAEARGQKGVDDDQDGFVDNLRGWNFVSETPDYMPGRFKTYFATHLEKIRELFSIHERIEKGESAAQLLLGLQGDSGLLDDAIEMSHGTHVAGIAALQSADAATLQNLNVSVPAELDSEADEKRDEIDFDHPEAVEAFVKSYLEREDTLSKRVSRYIRANGSGVVNISFGVSEFVIRYSYERLWREQLARKNLAPATRRSPAQEKLFERLIRQHIDAQKKYWAQIFNENSDVLFVIAASNEGRSNDDEEVLPANFSNSRKNVITVAATDRDGRLADFSNFGSRTVNLGAWGVAVPSLAPGDLELTMSGTSVAAPLVAATAAQIRQIAPEASAATVRALLEQTVRVTTSLQGYVTSGGALDGPAAIAAAGRVAGGESVAAAIAETLRLRQGQEPPVLGPRGSSSLSLFDDPFSPRGNANPGPYRSSEFTKRSLIRRAQRRAWQALRLGQPI